MNIEITRVNDVDNIILNYKYEIEHSDRFKYCLELIEFMRPTYINYSEDESISISFRYYDYIFKYDKMLKKNTVVSCKEKNLYMCICSICGEYAIPLKNHNIKICQC